MSDPHVAVGHPHCIVFERLLLVRPACEVPRLLDRPASALHLTVGAGDTDTLQTALRALSYLVREAKNSK